MKLYRLGTFWDKDELVADISEWVGIAEEDAIAFEFYVRSYCHNILSDGILNYSDETDPEQIQLKISRIVCHNIIGLKLYVSAVRDVERYSYSGDEHLEHKFNPIDNDNTDANLTREDVVQHHTLKSLKDALEILPNMRNILEDIYSELSHICLPCLNLTLVRDVVRYDLDGLIDTTTVTVDELTEDKVIDAFMNANPRLKKLVSTIEDFLQFDLQTNILDFRWQPYWNLTPLELEVLVNG